MHSFRYCWLPRSARWRPLCLIICMLLLGWPLSATPLAAQDSSITIEATPAYEGNYLPDRWLPVSIVLRNNGEATSALVTAALPNATTRNTQLVEMPGTSEVRLTLYVAMDRQAREIIFTVEQRDSIVMEQRVAVRPREGERLIGLISSQPLTLNLPLRQDLSALPFLPFPILAEDLPDQLAGLSSLSLIVLSDITTTSLSPEQLDVLQAWVRNGGHLIIGGGAGANATLSGLPEDLRIAQIGELQPLDPEPLAEYTDGPAPAQLEGVALQGVKAATSYLGDPSTPLWLSRDIGNGRVTQLAFNPAVRAISDWPNAPLLWDKLLLPTRIYSIGFGVDLSTDVLREQMLSSALSYLPAINLPNAEPLFIILVLYTMLIGPGMALILRRMDRQDLGWVLLPLAIVAFFALGTLVALNWRADERIVSQVSLIEQVNETTARTRTAAGILSPRSDQFDFTLLPQALVRPLFPASSSFASISAASGDLDQERGDMKIRVERWALQGVLADALVPLPKLNALITLSDQSIEVSVENTTEHLLRDVAVAYAGRAVVIGDLAPGATGRAFWPSQAGGQEIPSSLPLSRLIFGEQLDAGRGAGGIVDRRLLIREALINAAVGRGSLPEDPAPIVLAWLDQNPLAFDVAADGAAEQQINLLVGRPEITGSGSVFLPAGWAQLYSEAPGITTCTNGSGIMPTDEALVLPFLLPTDVAQLQVESLTFDMQSEREWPSAGVRVELFNWQSAEWVSTNFDGPGSLVISRDAGIYVRNGQVQLRLSGSISEAGCVFVQVRMNGQLAGPA